MSWYDARRAEQDAKYEVESYQAPSMYMKEENMDLHGLSDMSEYASPNKAPSQSSLQDNIDRCMKQCQRFEDLVAALNSRTSMVQINYSEGPENKAMQPRSEPGASEYANRVGTIWYRLEDMNDKLAAIVDRLDL